MLDQGFNHRNFRRIYDLENRKGANLEERFCLISNEFAELKDQTAAIKTLKAALKDALSLHKVEKSEDSRTSCDEASRALEDAVRRKEQFLSDYLLSIANSIARNGHNLTLTSRPIPGGKTLFISNNDPATFFIEKQIQHNISRLYKIKPGSRDVIIPQIISFCTGKFPLWGVRTDISDFYETIDHARLLRLLKADQLLNAPSIRYIQQVLYSYGHLTGSAVGLPRGNGISAYLAELFMRPIDNAIKGLADGLYYSRYVDDIIILHAQSPEWIPSDRLRDISDLIRHHGLTLNPAKTTEISNTSPPHTSFSYLGYEFKLLNGNCDVDISAAKLAKYRARIDKCFDVYNRSHARRRIAAGKILLKRITYLTTNTRLRNSKSNAYIGSFYGNRYANKLNSLQALDAFLRHKVGSIADQWLRARLSSCSFELGFKEQQFVHFNQRELVEIVRIWKNA